jgi:predicted amidohydrolase YtcJ
MARLHQAACLFIIGILITRPVAAASNVVLLHGNIYTGNTAAPWAQALSIAGSRIDAIGSDRDIAAKRGRHTRMIDLAGRTVIPGFVDSHVHMLFGAMILHGFNLSTPEASVTPGNPEVLIARTRELAARHPSDPILFGRADFSTAWPFAPTAELLDRAISDRPVIVHNTSEHALWLNSRALTLVGLTDAPLSDPLEEQDVIRDASGHPTGVVIEAGMEIVERAVRAQLSEEVLLAMLRDASRYLNRYGVTTVVNATGNLADVKLFAALHSRDELTVRTRTSFGAIAVPHRLTEQFLSDLEQARTQYHDDWVSANLVKFFADGGTGLIAPLVYQASQYKKIVQELDRRGYQLMTHVYRSDSVHLVLDAYEAAAGANGRRDRRFRIEHVPIVDAADIARFGPLGIVASMQPVGCCSENGWNYDPKATLPTDRWKTLSKAGALLALGSDWPCAWPPAPFVGIESAVTRAIWESKDTADVLGNPMDGARQAGARPTGKIYSPEERLTVREAIDAYTQGAAYAAFFEHRIGTLEVGKEADLAVLSQNVFEVAPTQISDTDIVMTMVAGKIVYSGDQPPTFHQVVR